MNGLLGLTGVDADSLLNALDDYTRHNERGITREDAIDDLRISPSLRLHEHLRANVDQMAQLVDDLVVINAWDSFYDIARQRYRRPRRGAQMQPFEIDRQESHGTHRRAAHPGLAAAFVNIICCQPLPPTGSQNSSEQGSEQDSSHDESSENSEAQDESTSRTASSDDFGCPDGIVDAVQDLTFTDNKSLT